MYHSKKIFTAAFLVFHLGLNAQVSVKSNGNIGLGTSAPQEKIHIAGKTLIDAYDNALTFNSPNNAWQFMAFKRGGNRQLWMGFDNGTGFHITKEVVGNMNFTLNQQGEFNFNQLQGGNTSFNLNPWGSIFMNMKEGRLYVTSQMDNNQIGGAINLVHPFKTASNQAKEWAIYNMGGGYGNSLQFWAYGPSSCNDFCAPRLVIMDEGNVGIGTMTPQHKLEVAGNVKGYNMITNTQTYADYVFEPTYRLRPLSEVEQYIKEYHHLPEVPTAAEVEKDGLNLGEHQVTLLKKVEELTLYVIEQQKQIKALQEQVEQMKSKGNK